VKDKEQIEDKTKGHHIAIENAAQSRKNDWKPNSGLKGIRG
jgi:hypothetical protein